MHWPWFIGGVVAGFALSLLTLTFIAAVVISAFDCGQRKLSEDKVYEIAHEVTRDELDRWGFN